jgi:hypothetical protein
MGRGEISIYQPSDEVQLQDHRQHHRYAPNPADDV